MAIFLRFAGRRRPAWDSLSADPYGVYVIHYGVVSWMLYLMLGASLPPTVKGVVVFACALAFSRALIALVRRVPAVARAI